MTIENEIDRGDDIVSDGGDTNDIVDLKDEVKDEVVKDEVEGEGKKDEKEPLIPKSRFDTAVGKARKGEKEAQARAEAAEAKLKAQTGDIDAKKVEEEIDELEEAMEGAIKDGNVELKKRLRAEIRGKNQALAEARAVVHAQYQSAIAIEQIRYDAVVDRIEAEHIELRPDEDNDDYDQDLVDEVQELKSAYEAKGDSSSEALKKAVKLVFRNQPKKEEKKEEVDGEAEKRKAEAVQRGLDTKKKQPVDNKKAGADSDKGGKSGKTADVTKMSNKDFDKLTPEEIAQMRGDNDV